MVFAPSRRRCSPCRWRHRERFPARRRRMEGAHRPGHFAGVATVVPSCLQGCVPIGPTSGRRTLSSSPSSDAWSSISPFPPTIVPHPTVREPDGLALSSRNVFLSEAGRAAARSLSRGLMAAADAAEAGERRAGPSRDCARHDRPRQRRRAGVRRVSFRAGCRAAGFGRRRLFLGRCGPVW